MSNEDGTVSVEWEFVEGAEDTIVELSWIERAGPAAKAPTEKGFGLFAIQSVLEHELDAKVDMDFQTDGLICRIAIPGNRFSWDNTAVEVGSDRADQDVSDETPTPGDQKLDRPLRILVVEDQWTIATELQLRLEAMGHEPIGPITKLQAAFTAADESEFDAAILDIQLGGDKVYPFAALLAERDIPFAFASGYTDTEVLPVEFRDRLYLSKPYENKKLQSILDHLQSLVAARQPEE